MPSISKVKLDEIQRGAEFNQKRYEDELRRANALDLQIRRFDDILDKVIAAAQGRPLRRSENGYGFSPGLISAQDSRMTDAERQEAREQQQFDRVVGLESRLAAVVAVAQFAIDHKA